MPLLTQSRFPRLWLLMQRTIGGNACKQDLATRHYRNQQRVLEIGCSVGNISAAFRRFPDMEFTGIDIDANALALAQRHFRSDRNFRFRHCALETLAQEGARFDYILFAGILHHVDDATGKLLIAQALTCLAPGGTMVIYDPEKTQATDSGLLRGFEKLFEQGAHLRTRQQLHALATHAGMRIEHAEDCLISPGVVTRPYVARFTLLVGRAPKQDAR